QTVIGSAQYAQQSDDHLAVLRNNVTSPGGTTAAGLAALEEGGLRSIISDGVWAAYERSVELGNN
ncbi:MAG: pyrroline-5-carboxylate reductase dimerization domain-containing protein, partial [Chloroflexota bacterium]